jgi:bifunctional DNA primase/polymerase-like protein
MSLERAQELAAKGMPVFPCSPSDKKPLTEHGFHDATTNPNRIGWWWYKWPTALIGVPAQRFVAVDLDLQHATARDWWNDNRESIPFTRTHYTRSGGLHLLFKPHPRVKNSAGKLAEHVDTRGAGGYIIWWPAEGHQVDNPDLLADIPEFIVAALNETESSAALPRRHRRKRRGILSQSDIDARVAGVVRTIVHSQEGQRNDRTFWGACRLAELVDRGYLDYEDAIAIVVEAASRNGLRSLEAKRTAKSALKTPLRKQ